MGIILRSEVWRVKKVWPVLLVQAVWVECTTRLKGPSGQTLTNDVSVQPSMLTALQRPSPGFIFTCREGF